VGLVADKISSVCAGCAESVVGSCWEICRADVYCEFEPVPAYGRDLSCLLIDVDRASAIYCNRSIL